MFCHASSLLQLNKYSNYIPKNGIKKTHLLKTQSLKVSNKTSNKLNKIFEMNSIKNMESSELQPLDTELYFKNQDKIASDNRLRIFSGTAHPDLANEITYYLGCQLGDMNISDFADKEKYVQIKESVRGCDVFLIQPSCPPVNDNLVELFIMIDACKRASCRSVTAVIPYYGYSRSDRKVNGREAISAKLMANLLTEAGIDRVLLMDLHSAQCVGYFDIPVNHVTGRSVLINYIQNKNIPHDELIVVSPDIGGVSRARRFAKELDDAPLAIIDKRRANHNEAEVMNIIGDVNGKVAILVDDMIDTAGTITEAAKALKNQGAKQVYACATHAIFSNPATERLGSGVFEEVIVTNTIPYNDKNKFPELKILSVAGLLGDAIWCLYNSISMTMS